ncbi:MAG: hypothetical protein H6505_02140 [Calditrichaeota bacterium]|nr:hypothetical protein [Calditrichota bacterium]
MRNRLPIWLVVVSLLVFGCAGKRTLLMEQVRTELRSTSTEQALAAYEKGVKKNTKRVDELLNLGLLALEAGKYDLALKSLKDADRLAEERLTKSLSREAASLTTSDRVRAYQGTVYDKAMLHYYQAVAYLELGDLNAATVEGRRLASYLEVNARESKHTYKDDPFLQWFSGVMYESFGQVNDAWISYKHAMELYPYYGIDEPDYLCRATYTALTEVGASEQEQELVERCPGVELDFDPKWGRVVVLCEAGIAPQILEDNVVFPIMTYDQHSWASNDDRERYAYDVYGRRYDHYDEAKLDYLLRVALPYYPEDGPGTSVQRVSVRGDKIDKLAELAAPVGSILRQDLSDRMPAIAARAIVRGIIKYAASKAAKEAGKEDSNALGEILGLGVNLLGAATEAADTRSWETLPDKIYVADFQLSPGEHDLRVIYEGRVGEMLLRYDLPTVTVKPGKLTVLRARCWK